MEEKSYYLVRGNRHSIIIYLNSLRKWKIIMRDSTCLTLITFPCSSHCLASKPEFQNKSLINCWVKKISYCFYLLVKLLSTKTSPKNHGIWTIGLLVSGCLYPSLHSLLHPINIPRWESFASFMRRNHKMSG